MLSRTTSKRTPSRLKTSTLTYDSAYAAAYVTKTCSPQTGSVTHCVSGTYDFNTGVLTSLTNENATAQASGNTPGDQAHTSNFAYDSMFRITSAQAPPDPANGGSRAQTSFTFSAPNTFPLSVQRTKSITTALSDSASNFFDGLGRANQGQHVHSLTVKEHIFRFQGSGEIGFRHHAGRHVQRTQTKLPPVPHQIGIAQDLQHSAFDSSKAANPD